jgi:nicotinamide-nucleotide amidase
MEEAVLARLKRLKGRAVSETLLLRTAGVVELHIERLLGKIGVPDSVQIGLYPHLKMVDLRLTAAAKTHAHARAVLKKLEQKLLRALGSTVYGKNEDRLEAVIGRLLLRKRQTLALAESCTGGIVSDRLTNIPGSSRYLRGGVVAYHNDLKANLLGVSGKILENRGAVSPDVARAMASGVRAITGATIGLSITGIAGPTGGTPTKPVGLVFMGLSAPEGSRTWRWQFHGTRETVKAQAAQTALNTLRLYLLGAD